MPTFAHERARHQGTVIASQLADYSIDLVLRFVVNVRERHGRNVDSERERPKEEGLLLLKTDSESLYLSGHCTLMLS